MRILNPNGLVGLLFNDTESEMIAVVNLNDPDVFPVLMNAIIENTSDCISAGIDYDGPDEINTDGDFDFMAKLKFSNDDGEFETEFRLSFMTAYGSPVISTDWAETHHEVVDYIAQRINEYYDDEENEDEPVDVCVWRHREQGQGGLYELAIVWTNLFHSRYHGVKWGEELDWSDTLERFLVEQDTQIP